MLTSTRIIWQGRRESLFRHQSMLANVQLSECTSFQVWPIKGIVLWWQWFKSSVVHVSFFSPVTRIKNDTGCAIKIPSDAENSNIIRIEGDPKGVAQAKQELMEMAKRMVGNVALHQKTRWLMLGHMMYGGIILSIFFAGKWENQGYHYWTTISQDHYWS